MITWSIGKKCIKFLKTILDGRDAILRVRVKWLIFNMVSQLWADVKYHVPTGFVFRRRRAVFILLAIPPTSRGGRRWCCGVADSSLSLKPQTKGTVLLQKKYL